MPYILRDDNDNVVGIAQSPQESWGGEWLPDDHPDVVAHLTPVETFTALAFRVLDESASPLFLAQLSPILPSIKLLAEAGTAKGIEAALLVLAGLEVPAELEDEKQLLLQKLGGG
jgi:hypothetical protein